MTRGTMLNPYERNPIQRPHQRAIIVIGTCARSGVSYLESTIKDIDVDFGIPRFILADGVDVQAPHPWIVHRYPGPSGTRLMLWRAAALCVNTQADMVVFSEDDVVRCRKAIRRAIVVGVPSDVSLVNYHDMSFCPPGSDYGLHIVPFFGAEGAKRDFHGTQFVVLSRRTCEFLLTKDPFGIERPDESAHPVNSGDVTMAYYLSQEPTLSKMAVHIPCLGRHFGHVSVAWPKDGAPDRNLPTNFPGMDFDASLLGEPKRFERGKQVAP